MPKQGAAIRIEIKFVGFPKLYGLFSYGFSGYDFSRRTLMDLIWELVRDNHETVRQSFFPDQDSVIDPTIQVRIQSGDSRPEYVNNQEAFNQKILREGDRVTFLRLLAGG